MTHILERLIMLLTLAALSISCDMAQTDVEEGVPTKLKICISIPNPGSVAVTKATDSQETKVNSVALLLYRNDNSLPLVVEQPTYGLPEVITSTSYSYTLEFEDENLTSGKWYLYALANYNYEGFGSVDLDQIKGMTKAQMDSYIVVKSNEYLDMIDDGLLLTGKFGDDGSITLQPSGNDFTGNPDAVIHLRRLTAKISFSIATAEGVQFIPEKYTVYNYSQSSTLMERTGWTQYNGDKSYKYGTFPGSLKYAGAEDATKRFTDLSRFISGNSFTFYMQENLQSPKSSFTDYNLREKRDTQDDPTSRVFKYAPDDGTYVVITGKYNGPGAKYNETTKEWEADPVNTVSGDVSYTIHLGNFSQGTVHTNTKGRNDNFTVRRNTRYNYIISINGVKNIIVEAVTDVENNSGAEGYLISNANSRNLELDAHFETVMIELPAEAIPEYIIRLSTPYQSTTYVPSKNQTAPTDVQWVHFAKPKSSNEFGKYPGTASASLTDVYGLMEELKNFNNASGEHYLYDNGKIYVTAFVDEYYYDTKPGTTTKASLSEFVNAVTRELSVVSDISVSSDTYSTYADKNLFSIKQASIKSMYNLSVDNPFGLETYEEFPDPVYKKNDSASSDPENWGWGNFVTNFNLGTDRWSAYVDSTKLGHFDNYNEISTEGIVQNYGDIQCITRNRDENGNGIIDREEVKWYLPSHNECLTIWNGFNALSDQARVNEGHQHYTSSNGYGRYWWNDEGSAFGIYYTGWFYTPLVRCVRALNDYDGTTTKVSSVDGQVISVDGLGEGSLRSNGKKGEYAGGHYRNEAPDILPKSFVVATKDLSFTGKTSTVIMPPILRACGYDGSAWFAISNYQNLVSEGYSIYYTVGSSTTKTSVSSEAVTGITPVWTDDKMVINLYSTITISGTEYTSNPTVATITRSAKAQSGYVYSTTISHGTYNTADSTYPYVSAAEYTSDKVGFMISNFNMIGTNSYGVNIARGSSATSASWFGYYPFVQSAAISGENLNINLYDIQNGYYYYIIGQSGKYATNYAGTSVGNTKTATIPLSSLVWSDNKAVVTVYTNYSGGVNDYRATNYQTVITVTRNFKEGKSSYTVNGGDWNELSDSIEEMDVYEDMWSSNGIVIKVFNNSYLGAAYLSTITLKRTEDNYTYGSTMTNGAIQSYTSSTTATKSTFTPAEVRGSNYCEQYYYEKSDKSDLGLWRIPNERELGLMYEYFSLTPTTASRTLYYRKFDTVPSSQLYSLTLTGNNIFTGGLPSYVIRCVRDN